MMADEKRESGPASTKVKGQRKKSIKLGEKSITSEYARLEDYRPGLKE